MKLTPTNKFLALASGSAKVLSWKFYLKAVTATNGSLTSGTWTDITDKIVNENFTITQKIEYEPGQFTSDSFTVNAMGISYFRDTWFRDGVTTNPNNLVEFKIEFQLGDTSPTTDILYMFAGFVDFVGIKYVEVTDVVTFRCYSADDLAGLIAAENITTQYIDTTIGSNILMMQSIQGVYCRDANLSGYPLKMGVHTVTFAVNGGLKQAKLDNGAYKTLVGGNNDIGDVDNSTGDTQRVRLYVKSAVDILSSGTYTDFLIQLTPNTTLPYQWYLNVSTKYLLKKIYGKFGITTVNFDSMFINTYDGASKISYLDTPPSDESITGQRKAMVGSSTDLYIAIGNKVYKRASDESYSAITTLSTFTQVCRMFLDTHNNLLWVLTGTYLNISGVRLVSLTTFNSSDVTLTGSSTTKNMYAFDYVDYNYTGASYHTSLMYVDGQNSNIRELVWNGNTGPPTATDTLIGFSGGLALARYVYHNGSTWKVSLAATYRQLTISAANAWVDGGTQTQPGGYSVGAFSSTDSKLYYTDGGGNVFYHTENSGIGNAIANITYNGTSYSFNSVQDLTYCSDGSVYGYGAAGTIWGLFKISNAVATLIAANTILVDLSAGFPLVQQTIVAQGTKILGIGGNGVLWQYHTTLNLFVGMANFQGQDVRSALTAVLKAGNLVSTTSMTKQAYVYRRGNVSGVPQSTGNILTLNVSDVAQIEETLSSFQNFSFISVSGESSSVTFDGSSFGATQLSNSAIVSIDNQYIPDLLIKDMTFYFYQFFKNARRLIKVRTAGIPLFQYEVFDAVNVNFLSPTKLQRVISGTNTPIYSISYTSDGDMLVEFLVSQEPTTIERWDSSYRELPRKKKQLDPARIPSYPTTPTATRAV